MLNEFIRTGVRDESLVNSGPYEAIIVDHLDPMYMGTLRVELLHYSGAMNTPLRSGQLFTVRYLSPFYGVTPSQGVQPNDGYQFTQKSYGMWAVPPDVGTRVLVIFVEGNSAYGYWIGCVQDQAMNFMLPDGRASTEITTDATPGNLKGTKLPVGEYNKKIETGSAIDPTFFKKPYNKDFTDILETQGLLVDEIRGTTTSSARREVPSMVFGISTPGPLDKREGFPRVNYGTDTGFASVPFNRLGGSSFVMDDGDDKFIRETHAECGPPIYINKEAGEPGGDETIPQNELIRLRTRTGHQILLHNSEDLIYIGNSRGTAWIEITSDGKIDIHAQDSISIMSDNDINFTAERDFNVEAGRNINMKAVGRWTPNDEEVDSEKGRIQLEAMGNYNLFVAKDGKVTIGKNYHTGVVETQYNSTGKSYHLYTGENNFFTAGKNTHILSGNQHRETAKRIYMNGPRAASANPAEPVELLSTITLPYVFPGASKPVPYESILARAPQHEPYPHHENMDPIQYKRGKTDRENPGALATADRILTPDTFAKNKGGRATSVSVDGSGGGISSGYAGGSVGGNVGAGGVPGGSVSRSGAPSITGDFSGATVPPGDRLGVLSGYFESGGDPTVVANNPGDIGGPSYGEFQIAANTGTMNNYMEFLRTNRPSLYAELQAAGGAAAARRHDPAFVSAWQRTMRDPANAETQYGFIYESHFAQSNRRIISNTGVDISTYSRTVQDVLFSTATQHGAGGAATVFQRALASTGSNRPNDAELIRAVYAERGRVDNGGVPVYFRNSSPSVQRSVLNRFRNENQRALGMLNAELNTSTTPPVIG